MIHGPIRGQRRVGTTPALAGCETADRLLPPPNMRNAAPSRGDGAMLTAQDVPKPAGDARDTTMAGGQDELAIAVLIPCYNEEQAIATVVADFRAALPQAAIYV